jgi:FixJ family two-component response regulator
MVEKMMNVLVYIVDDDQAEADLIKILLKRSNMSETKIFTDPDEFLKTEETIDICILDYRFQNSGLDGLTITEELVRRNKRCRIIIITVQPDFRKFMKVFNAGAWKYLDKSDDEYENDLVKYVKLGIDLVAEEIELIARYSKRFKNAEE